MVNFASPNQKTRKSKRKSVSTRKVKRTLRPDARSARKSGLRLHGGRHDSSTPFSLPQKIVMAVIGLVILTVAVATIFALKFDTKFQVEAKIADLARYYYEQHFYPEAFDGTVFSPEAEAVLAPYAESGLSPVSLSQLILTNPLATDADRNFLNRYCNILATNVTFFPEAPYAADSYRTEITYSCNYE